MGFGFMGASGLGSSTPAYPGYAYVNQGLTNGIPNISNIQLGIPFPVIDSKGRVLVFMGVQYNPTSPPETVVVGPVYFKDNTLAGAGGAGVTSNIAEAVFTNGPNCIAGILLNPNVTVGNLTILQVGGYFGASSDPGNQNGLLIAPSGGVTGDETLVPGTTSQSFAAVAAGTAPTYMPIGVILTTASATDAFDIRLTLAGGGGW